ncbi:hypothetical protein Bbelb_132650 [Branchiostoma belcheri]|nr:hypothetical protein Bbelb_132650 [Branchiostoma belcheri]
MIVCVPAVPNIADDCAKKELDTNTLSLRRFQSDETLSVIEEARSCTAADTALATQAEIHQYSNVDTSGDFEDAAPDEEEMMYGTATANSVYEDTNLNQSNSTSHNYADTAVKKIVYRPKCCRNAHSFSARKQDTPSAILGESRDPYSREILAFFWLFFLLDISPACFSK